VSDELDLEVETEDDEAPEDATPAEKTRAMHGNIRCRSCRYDLDPEEVANAVTLDPESEKWWLECPQCGAVIAPPAKRALKGRNKVLKYLYDDGGRPAENRVQVTLDLRRGEVIKQMPLQVQEVVHLFDTPALMVVSMTIILEPRPPAPQRKRAK